MAEPKKKVYVVRRASEQQTRPAGDTPLQLPPIASSTPRGSSSTVAAAATGTAGKPRKQIIVERRAKPAGTEALEPLTPAAEAVPVPSRVRGPLVDGHGDLVDWSVLGDPEDFRAMQQRQQHQAEKPQSPAKPPQQQHQRGSTKSAPTQRAAEAAAAAAATPTAPQQQQQQQRRVAADDVFGASVPALEHAQLERQARALERFAEVQEEWRRVGDSIASRLGRDAGTLTMAQAESQARARHEYEFVSVAGEVAAGKAVRPLFEEPFRPGKGSQLVGRRRELRPQQLERYGKPGQAHVNPPMSTYYIERREELREQLGIVDPFEPDIDRLFVQGVSVASIGHETGSGLTKGVLRKWPQQSRTFSYEYEETVPYSASGEEDTTTTCPATPGTMTSFYPCSEDTHYSTAVNYDEAEYRPRMVPKAGPALELSDDRILLTGAVGELVSCNVTAHNTGTTAVFFEWKREAQKPLPTGASVGGGGGDGRFFFNSQGGVVLPGDHKLFTFVFRSHDAGIFHDSWKLHTTPAVAEPIAIQIKAVALPKKPSLPPEVIEEARRVDEELQRKGVLRAMRRIVDEDVIGRVAAVHRARAAKPLTETEVAFRFASANKPYGVVFSPGVAGDFGELARDAGLSRCQWEATLSIGALEETISGIADDGQRDKLTARLEDLLVKAAVPTRAHSWDRPRIASVCRMLLAQAASKLQQIEEVVEGGLPFALEQQQQAEQPTETPAAKKPKRTFAAYLEKMADAKKKHADSSGSSSSAVAAAPPLTPKKAGDEQQHFAGEAQQQGRRRRGQARAVAATTPTAPGQQQTEPQAAVSQPPPQQQQQQKAATAEQPSQQRQQQAPTSAQQRAARRRRGGQREQQDHQEEDHLTHQPEGEQQHSSPQQETPTSPKQRSESAAGSRSISSSTRRSEVAKQFRANLCAMLDDFGSLGGISPAVLTAEVRRLHEQQHSAAAAAARAEKASSPPPAAAALAPSCSGSSIADKQQPQQQARRRQRAGSGHSSRNKQL